MPPPPSSLLPLPSAIPPPPFRSRNPKRFFSPPSPQPFLFYSTTTTFLSHSPKSSSFNPDSDSDSDPIQPLHSESNTSTPTPTPTTNTLVGDAVFIEVEDIGNNTRRIRSHISLNASLETVWTILTDYERLADFIPGLAVSRLLERGQNFAKVFQVGEQNLALGLKFNAKGIVECYEKDLERLPFGQRRDIEFKMVEGDFQIFVGKWSIVQDDVEERKEDEVSEVEEFQTTLFYIVDVQPKLWLPVGLVEGRLCREFELNLLSIREEARRALLDTLPSL